MVTGSGQTPNPAVRTAARQLEEFGHTGWHLVASQDYDPSAAGTVAPHANRFERRVVQVGRNLAKDFPALDGSAVFLMKGEPRPKVGDGLVALTCFWRIEKVNAMDPGGSEAIYAVLCV